MLIKEIDAIISRNIPSLAELLNEGIADSILTIFKRDGTKSTYIIAYHFLDSEDKHSKYRNLEMIFDELVFEGLACRITQACFAVKLALLKDEIVEQLGRIITDKEDIVFVHPLTKGYKTNNTSNHLQKWLEKYL
jgi:hypothetical protein